MLNRRAVIAVATPAMAVGLVLLPVTGAFAATGTFSTSANGGNEVGKAGDADATASGMFTADDGSGQFATRLPAQGSTMQPGCTSTRVPKASTAAW